MTMNIVIADDTPSPTDVVQNFWKLDGEGARLSWKSSYLIDHLVDPKVSETRPGWDTFDIVAKHRVIDEKIDGDAATVTVKFTRKGIAAINQLVVENQEDTFEFELYKKDTGWIITKEPPNPNVSIESAIEKFESLYAKQDESTKEEMDDILKQLKKWKEECAEH